MAPACAVCYPEILFRKKNEEVGSSKRFESSVFILDR